MFWAEYRTPSRIADISVRGGSSADRDLNRVQDRDLSRVQDRDLDRLSAPWDVISRCHFKCVYSICEESIDRVKSRILDRAVGAAGRDFWVSLILVHICRGVQAEYRTAFWTDCRTVIATECRTVICAEYRTVIWTAMLAPQEVISGCHLYLYIVYQGVWTEYRTASQTECRTGIWAARS